MPLAQFIRAEHVAERCREFAPRGFVAEVSVFSPLVLLGLRAKGHGHFVACVYAASVRVEVDSLWLHVPRRVERFGSKHEVNLFAGLEFLAEVLGNWNCLLEKDPAPLRAAFLLDRLLE